MKSSLKREPSRWRSWWLKYRTKKNWWKQWGLSRRVTLDVSPYASYETNSKSTPQIAVLYLLPFLWRTVTPIEVLDCLPQGSFEGSCSKLMRWSTLAIAKTELALGLSGMQTEDLFWGTVCKPIIRSIHSLQDIQGLQRCVFCSCKGSWGWRQFHIASSSA